uniref:Surface-associated antigen n=1 Tax=Heterorhabditis bacteriophora TaxID=37862 RepID=B0FZ58_HETBA|nr:surface-associated antigen [Heterorhabditis bacteriophora]
MLLRVTVIFIFIAAVYAGFFDDVSGVASDVGDFFTKQYSNVKDLLAGNQSELEKNIKRVKDLLIAVKEKAKMLELSASETQKQTISQVDNFINQITQFEQQAEQSGQAKFEENKAKWQELVENIFEKGGLEDVLKLLNVKGSSPASLVTAAILSLVFAFVC